MLIQETLITQKDINKYNDQYSYSRTRKQGKTTSNNVGKIIGLALNVGFGIRGSLFSKNVTPRKSKEA